MYVRRWLTCVLRHGCAFCAVLFCLENIYMISWKIPEMLCKNNENVKAIVLIISVIFLKHGDQ